MTELLECDDCWLTAVAFGMSPEAKLA